MRIGIISEGRPDQAVIENILDGVFDDFELILIRPKLESDTTDIQLKNLAALGGLSRVKADCEEKTLFTEFFDQDIQNEDFMIIQLDTAEIETFSVVRPTKKSNNNYVSELRTNVIDKIKEWLDDEEYDNKIIHAISIEELEAWLLTIFENKDSISSMNPKAKLKKLLSKKNKSSVETYQNYHSLSKDFSKKKKLVTCCKRNESLSFFVQELTTLFKSDEEE